MTKQLDALGIWSPTNIVNAKHEVLTVEPSLLLSTNHLSLAKHGDERKLLTGPWRSHDRAHIVGGLR
jgi:hypothetical protein